MGEDVSSICGHMARPPDEFFERTVERHKVRGKSELVNGIQKLHGGSVRISEATELNNQ